jgi:hypothetical protein
MLEQGSIRFAPASSYRDASLNAAIQDDELGFTYYPGKAGLPLTKLPHPDRNRLGRNATPERLLRAVPQPAVCTATIRRLRGGQLPDHLRPERIRAAGSCEALRMRFPDWFVTAFGMTYIDPDNPGDEPILLPRAKHMRYIYQQEQRILCHPRTPVGEAGAHHRRELVHSRLSRSWSRCRPTELIGKAYSPAPRIPSPPPQRSRWSAAKRAIP